MSAWVHVLLVDDDDLMLAGLRTVLSSDDSIEVVGEAGDGREGVELAASSRPDVLVRMPDMDGIAATRELLERVPSTKVIVLTAVEEDDNIFGSLSALPLSRACDASHPARHPSGV
jgi:DNA-binding NarL/FixJ family response regulator